MPGGRLQPLARAMREYVQLDIESRGEREPSFDEAVDRVERGSVSRRELLKIGGAFGAAFALAACTTRNSKAGSSTGSAPFRTASPTAQTARIVVIGAGLAGTTAAYRLSQQGLPVQLYEARDRIGGRCWTSREGWADAQTAEHGGEFIDTRHVHLIGLSKELGLKLDDLYKSYMPGLVWPKWVNGGYFSRDTVKADVARISKAVTAEGHKIGVFDAKGKASDAAISYGTATPEAVSLDQISMQDWMSKNVPGVSTDMTAYLNEIMASWYGLDMPSLSAANWVDFFLIPYPGGDERWHIQGGNDQVPHITSQKLPTGSVHMESPLEAMSRRSDGTYELRFGGSASSKPVIADFVIMTAPWIVLRDADLDGAGFPEYRNTAIKTLGMGTDVKLLVQYDKRPYKFKVEGHPWGGGFDHTDPNYDAWESSAEQPGTAGLITVYAGGSGSAAFADATPHGPGPDPLVKTIVGQIDQMVPGTAKSYNGKAWLDYWTGDPWTRGSYAAFPPGQMTKYWGYNGIPEGNVHFAGEHTSTYSQGFLNGGVESGQRAAIEVMNKLGVAVPKDIASLPYSQFPASDTQA